MPSFTCGSADLQWTPWGSTRHLPSSLRVVVPHVEMICEVLRRKGRKLSWERARQEWTDAYREKFEKFLIDTLYFPDATPPEESPAEGRAKPGDKSVVFVP